MCLRKSPTRTPALLAANRANAAKSTGPRTARGKRVSAWNKLRHGFRSRAPWAGEPRDARDAAAFEAFVAALRVAMVPQLNQAGDRSVRAEARIIWKAKHVLEHWLHARPWPVGPPPWVMPPCVTLRLNRPGTETCHGWRVKATVTIRWGRRPRFVPTRDGLLRVTRTWLARTSQKARAHTVLSVTCANHPWTRRYKQRLRTNPECHRRGEAWKDAVDYFEGDGTGTGLAPADFGVKPDPGWHRPLPAPVIRDKPPAVASCPAPHELGDSRVEQGLDGLRDLFGSGFAEVSRALNRHANEAGINKKGQILAKMSSHQ
jgi:hypothetical protein